LYRAGVEAETAGDYERAATLWEQILAQDSHFRNDQLAAEVAALEPRLHDSRARRARELARAATEEMRWQQAASAWRELLDLEPADVAAQQGIRLALREFAMESHHDGDWAMEAGAWEALLKIEPGTADAQERMVVARENQANAFFYTDAQDFVKSGNLAAARAQLEKLWSRAKYYGDPAGIASTVGVAVPPTFEEVKAREQAEREEQERIAAAAQAEQRRKDEAERARTIRIAELRTEAKTHVRNKAWREAVTAWENLLTLAPGDAEATAGIGNARRQVVLLEQDERRQQLRSAAKTAEQQKNWDIAEAKWTELAKLEPGKRSARRRRSQRQARKSELSAPNYCGQIAGVITDITRSQ
jgi:hypothetical protein